MRTLPVCGRVASACSAAALAPVPRSGDADGTAGPGESRRRRRCRWHLADCPLPPLRQLLPPPPPVTRPPPLSFFSLSLFYLFILLASVLFLPVCARGLRGVLWLELSRVCARGRACACLEGARRLSGSRGVLKRKGTEAGTKALAVDSGGSEPGPRDEAPACPQLPGAAGELIGHHRSSGLDTPGRHAALSGPAPALPARPRRAPGKEFARLAPPLWKRVAGGGVDPLLPEHLGGSRRRTAKRAGRRSHYWSLPLPLPIPSLPLGGGKGDRKSVV